MPSLFALLSDVALQVSQDIPQPFQTEFEYFNFFIMFLLVNQLFSSRALINNVLGSEEDEAEAQSPDFPHTTGDKAVDVDEEQYAG